MFVHSNSQTQFVFTRKSPMSKKFNAQIPAIEIPTSIRLIFNHSAILFRSRLVSMTQTLIPLASVVIVFVATYNARRRAGIVTPMQSR